MANDEVTQGDRPAISEMQPPHPRVVMPDNLRRLQDNTLLVFLSDTHIGGDPGFDIFESPKEVAALLQELAAHDGAVELVLAGDFFDFLHISSVPSGQNRATITLARPEYHTLFTALRHFATIEAHRVIYLPGNHDAEMWWNPEIQKILHAEGLVDDFALTYIACFESCPDKLIYCEHGNQFDSANAITDYSDPLDTPLGTHIVTDVLHRILPHGQITKHLDLHDLNFVFPLVAISDWVASRLFYDLVRRAILYVIVPLLAAYAIKEGLLILQGEVPIDQENAQLPSWLGQALIEIGYDALLLITTFTLFFIGARSTIEHMLSSMLAPSSTQQEGSGQGDDAPLTIQALLAKDHSPPLQRGIMGQQISVFISGHTHAPSLSEFQRSDGKNGVVVNSGCWLKQLQPVKAHLGGPSVFVAKFVQTHVRVSCHATRLRVELWGAPRLLASNLLFTERLAILGNQPVKSAIYTKPQVRTNAEL